MCLTEDEFWGSTFKEFDALVKRHNIQRERQDYRAALICAVLANINTDPKQSKVYTPRDFMPTKQAQVSQAKQTAEDMFGLINMIYGERHGK